MIRCLHIAEVSDGLVSLTNLGDGLANLSTTLVIVDKLDGNRLFISRVVNGD